MWASPAFLPASRSGAKDQAEMEKLVGQEIQCRIIKLDTASEDVVVDRRVILEEEEAQAREQKFGELKEGAVRARHRSQRHRFRRVCRFGRRGRAAACGRHGLASRDEAVGCGDGRAIPSK